MGEIEDSAAGITLAKSVAEKTGEGDSSGVLAEVNAATPGELAWAFTYTSQMLWESMTVLAGGDEARALKMLRTAMEGDDDIINAQMRLMSGEDDR